MSISRRFDRSSAAAAIVATTMASPLLAESPKVTVDQDGTVHIPAYAVPLSPYMSEEAQRAYTNLRLHWPSEVKVSLDNVEQTRKTVDSGFLKPRIEKARSVYPVNVEERTIAGVRTDVVTPKNGVPKHNEHRVLISLHGGGFFMAGGPSQLIDAIPMAGAARIKVIAIDFRQGPEHKFPAASEDVAAVYKELLKQYRPQNIGIFGHSTGGTLAAMSIAWFQRQKLPRPAAIVIISAPTVPGGDLYYMSAPLGPLFNSRAPAPALTPKPAPYKPPYLADADMNDPLVSPFTNHKVLAGFPPTLIVTGTRDSFASGLIHTHRQLVKAGVDSQLELWEGMWHGSLGEMELPETKEVFDVTAKFFAAHLGK